jgi:uncharacterized protein
MKLGMANRRVMRHTDGRKERAMIDPELLSILVCPETGTPLRETDGSSLQRINQAILAGKVSNRAGRPVLERLEGALIRDDRLVLYPIIDDIPVLLLDEGILLDQIGGVRE